mmetsp:Transcript_6655/g.11202  ORF Transcript_6655/g.11202 Transcript_6655/m.11202 type:complete len:245 (-) Transcript_6655:727-1461(-)
MGLVQRSLRQRGQGGSPVGVYDVSALAVVLEVVVDVGPLDHVGVHVLRVEEVHGVEIGDADGGGVLEGVEDLEALGLDELQILTRVLVLHVEFGVEVQLFVLAQVLVVVVQGQVVVQLLPKEDAGLVRPAAGHVLDGVATTAEHEHRHTPLLNGLDAVAVAPQRRVVGAQLVVGQRVGAALEHHDFGAVADAHSLGHVLEDFGEAVVGEPVEQWHVDGVALARALADVVDVARSRKKSRHICGS